MVYSSIVPSMAWKRTSVAYTGFCIIFATGMFQTSSKYYDRAVLLWSRPIVLATTLPNKEGSWVLGLQGSVAKILQNPVWSANREI